MTRALLLAALVACVDSASAATKHVRFTATVVASPFGSGVLSSGRSVTGLYALDTAAAPTSSAPNVAQYDLGNGSLVDGITGWTTDTARAYAAANAGIRLPEGATFFQPADFHEATFYSLNGPLVQNHRVLYSSIYLVDTDATVFGGQLPPIVPPPLGAVEQRVLVIGVSIRPGVDSALVQAQIDSLQILDSTRDLTGSGWIDSPQGSVPVSPAVGGKAKYSFDVKYKKHAPDPVGRFQISLPAAGMRFDGTSLERLIADDTWAQLTGTCIYNGSPAYGAFRFMATAVAHAGGKKSGRDELRVVVWDDLGVVVYDSLPGSPDFDETAAVGGGHIVVHKAKSH